MINQLTKIVLSVSLMTVVLTTIKVDHSIILREQQEIAVMQKNIEPGD